MGQALVDQMERVQVLVQALVDQKVLGLEQLVETRLRLVVQQLVCPQLPSLRGL